MCRKLYRSGRDKKIAGLCGGLGEYFHVDTTIIRLVVVATTLFSGGTIIPLYIIGSFIIPKDPAYLPQPHPHPQYGYGAPQDPYFHNANQNIDEMMKNIEQKAMKQEIEQLRAKLAQYEKKEV